jgi:hypothetical protein
MYSSGEETVSKRKILNLTGWSLLTQHSQNVPFAVFSVMIIDKDAKYMTFPSTINHILFA